MQTKVQLINTYNITFQHIPFLFFLNAISIKVILEREIFLVTIDFGESKRNHTGKNRVLEMAKISFNYFITLISDKIKTIAGLQCESGKFQKLDFKFIGYLYDLYVLCCSVLGHLLLS